MLKWIVNAALAPITKLGEAWIKHKNDKQALEHGTQRVAIQSATTFGVALLATAAGQIALLVLLVPINLHVAAVVIDSTWPSDWIAPLAMPARYNTIMEMVVGAQLGVAAWRKLRG